MSKELTPDEQAEKDKNDAAKKADPHTPEVVTGKTSLIQVEGEATPKKFTTLVEDITKDVAIVAGVSFAVEFAQPLGPDPTLEDDFRSVVVAFAERRNLGVFNLNTDAIKEFESDVDKKAKKDAADEKAKKDAADEKEAAKSAKHEDAPVEPAVVKPDPITSEPTTFRPVPAPDKSAKREG